MRDYRGKRKDNGEWVKGWLIKDESGEVNIVNNYGTSYSWDEVDPKTVGQYTGLLDENGIEIYGKDRFQHENDIGTVVFRNGMFCVEWDAPVTFGKDTLLWKLHDGGTVIHDNPNLLGG